MNAFRSLLIVLWIVMLGVTAVVIVNHGINLFPVFFGDIADMTWRGQFNVDFSCFLVLSATWLMWRHEFSPIGIVVGVIGFFGGALFLTAYLLIASFAANGDMKEVLLGKGRSSAAQVRKAG